MIVKNMKEFHRTVCEREDYTCQVCEKSFNYPCYFKDNGRNLYVCGHHKKSQKAYPELKLETDNGKCICFECHLETHNGNIPND